MNIAFPSIDEEYLKKKVDMGFYGNITEVVRDAVRRMRELEERRKLEELRLLLAIGLDQAEQGKLLQYDPSLLDNLLDQARENSKQGKIVKNAIKSS